MQSRMSWSHAEKYSFWAGGTCAGICAATLFDWIFRCSPWAGEHEQAPSLACGLALCFASISLAIMLAVRQHKTVQAGTLPSEWATNVLSLAGVLFGVVTVVGIDSATLGLLESSRGEGERILSSVGAASAACLASCVKIDPALQRWRPTLAGMSFLAGYALLLGYLYGARWLGTLPLASVLMLASTAVLATGRAPIGAKWQPRSVPTRAQAIFQSAALVVLLFPVEFGAERSVQHNESNATIFVLAAIISASLSSAVLAAVSWIRSGNQSKVEESAQVADVRLATSERALDEVRSELMKAEEIIRSRTEFLVHASHELRTPLTSMLGFAQLMDLDPTDPLSSKQRSNLAHVERAGQHLQSLVDDMLDLARIDTGHVNIRLGMVPLHTLLEGSVDMLRPLADELGITLERPVVDCGLFVWADELRLNQILINLLGNALKYNHRGGVVWVTVNADALTIDRLGAPMLNVAIHDTGQGIAPADLLHLFEPFNRLGQEYGETVGSGLGLALSRSLAHMMQGGIEAYSKLGVGTELVLKLRFQKD